MIASKDAFPSEEAFNKELEQMNETCEQIKQHLVDTNRIVKKGTSGISYLSREYLMKGFI